MTTTPDLWRNPFFDNTSVTGNQDSGVVAATASDTFFAVWRDANANPDHIFARSFNIEGNPTSPQTDIIPSATRELADPAAVRLPIAGQGDGLAVAFTDFDPANLLQDIVLVRMNAALVPLETSIAIENRSVLSDHPSITSFSDGSLWVAYTVLVAAPTDQRIFARRIDANGNVIGDPITIFDAPVRADNSDLATLQNGNVVAVFEASKPAPNFNDSDIFFTIRRPDGTIVVDTTGVSGGMTAGIAESDPHVAALADGGFVVTFTDAAGDSDGSGIRAAVYNANGTLAQGSILVNFFHQAGAETNSDVTALPDGGFIVAWADNNGPVERAQRFDEAGNLVGTDFTVASLANTNFHTNAATFEDGRAILTNNFFSTGIDVQTSIWDSRITDANQTTGDNFFGAVGGPADLFLIRDIFSGDSPVRQLEAIQTNGTATVFGTVGFNQAFVGSGDFNGDGLSDLLINVDNPATQQRTFLVDQMNPTGIQAQFQIAVRGADWVVDATADFNHNGTSDILVHRDVGANRTLEVMVMNNNAVVANTTIGVDGINWQVDGTGDFNNDGTPDILQHQINLSNGSMTLRALSMSPNAVQVQSSPTLGTIGATWQVDGTGDFNHDGTSDILVHQDSPATGARTFQVLTVKNNAITGATTIATTGDNISVGGIGDFNNDGTSDFLVHQETSGTARVDNVTVYNVVNNAVVSTQTIAVTGIDWHIS